MTKTVKYVIMKQINSLFRIFTHISFRRVLLIAASKMPGTGQEPCAFPFFRTKSTRKAAHARI